MSMFGNIAVEVEMNKFLKLMDEMRGLPPEEQLKLLRKEMEDIRGAAKSGWL